MIERGEFVIQDSGTMRDIDLSSDWETCFRPGQRVDMSMTFTQGDFEENLYSCPKCKKLAGWSASEDTEW